MSAVSPWLECYELQWSLYYPCIGTHWISYTCIYILMSCKSHIFHSTWFINTLLWYRSLGVMWDFPGVGQLNTHPTWRTIFCFPAWSLYMGKGTSHFPRCQLRKKKQKNSRIDVKGPNQTGPWHLIPPLTSCGFPKGPDLPEISNGYLGIHITHLMDGLSLIAF